MGNTFRGGIPYAIDLRRMTEEFPLPSLTEGRVIRHAELEGVLNLKRGHQRYYSVVNAWIGQVRNANGVFIVWEPSVGIKVLGPAEILNHAEVRTRQKLRQTGRAIKTFAWVDRNRLDAVGQQRLDHQTRVVSALRDALDSSRKELAVNLAPVRSLPRPKLA